MSSTAPKFQAQHYYALAKEIRLFKKEWVNVPQAVDAISVFEYRLAARFSKDNPDFVEEEWHMRCDPDNPINVSS